MPYPTRRGLLTLAAILCFAAGSGPALGHDRSCKKDADCVLVLRPLSKCRCVRCGGMAVNRKAWEKWKKKAPLLRCRKLPVCPRCEPFPPGSRKAACVKGRCEVRPVVKSSPGRGVRVKATAKDLRCKRHKDCGWLPAVCGRCAPCKPTWRPVGNQQAIRRIRGIQSIVDCAPLKCRPCAKAKNWKGTRVVCLKGRCAPR